MTRNPALPEEGPPKPAADRLDSWKEIAVYLRCGARTVQRWEKTEGLPVHRHVHEKLGTVYAYKSELDAWWSNRRAQLEHVRDNGAVADAATSGHRRLLWMLVLAGALVTGSVVAWFFRPWYRTPAPQPLRTIPLTSYPGSERYPSFSPDGDQVAFSWKREGQNNFDIYVKQVGIGEPLRLTQDPADDVSPAWSPDGRFIAFLRMLAPQKASIFVIPALGGSERKIADTSAPPSLELHYGAHLAWSPDNEWLVVPDGGAPGEPSGLFLVSLATGEKRRLTSPPPKSGQDVAPALSPDGRSLAFIRTVSFAASELHLMALSDSFVPAGEPKQVTFDGRLNGSPLWTPDGRELLFRSGYVWSEWTLWRTHTSGIGKPRRVASFDDAVQFAIARRSSGDSTRLAYTRNLFDPNIWRVELAAPNSRAAPPRRFISSTRVDFEPQYSPDAKEISFTSSRSGSPEIWVCDSDGANARQLTNFGGPLTSAARWSPDGGRLIFNSRPKGRSELFLISAAGGAPKTLVEGPGNSSMASWSRDGRWIYFNSDRSGEGQIWKIPSEGGKPVQITRKGGLSPLESPDGRFLYYSSHSRLWRVPISGGPETQVLESVNHPSVFAVVQDGIYFIPKPDPPGDASIQFLRFAGGTIRRIASIEKPPFVGLSVSRDGRFLLYAQVDEEGSDLMLVENLSFGSSNIIFKLLHLVE